MRRLSLTRLATRLPSILVARLLLALLLVCNLTLCVSMHGLPLSFDNPDRSAASLTHAKAMPNHTMPAFQLPSSDAKHDPHPEATQVASPLVSPCHQGNEITSSADSCQMQSGVSGSATLLPLLTMLLSLLLLPLLLLPCWRDGGQLLERWLRDPFLRSRGTHPPSWPRRHLMLSVLRH